MRLAVIYPRQITIFIRHGVKHDSELLDEVLSGLVFAEVLLAILDQLRLHLLHHFVLIEHFFFAALDSQVCGGHLVLVQETKHVRLRLLNC